MHPAEVNHNQTVIHALQRAASCLRSFRESSERLNIPVGPPRSPDHEHVEAIDLEPLLTEVSNQRTVPHHHPGLALPVMIDGKSVLEQASCFLFTFRHERPELNRAGTGKAGQYAA